MAPDYKIRGAKDTDSGTRFKSGNVFRRSRLVCTSLTDISTTRSNKCEERYPAVKKIDRLATELVWTH